MHPTTSFMIVENNRDELQPMDGELYHGSDALFRALPYADADAMVMQLDLAEFIRDGATNARDVTEDMVQAAWDAGHLTRDDDIAAAHLDFPETRDEHLGNIADREWHERVA